MSKPLTTEEFIEKAIKIHGDKYDYSKVEYANSKTKVCIICPNHGEFWQKPCDHLSGCRCPKCANDARKTGRKTLKTTDEFIDECMEKYGDRYDFTKTVYKTANDKIILFDKYKNCEVETRPSTMLNKNLSNKIKLSKENFVIKAKEKFGNKYIYMI